MKADMLRMKLFTPFTVEAKHRRPGRHAARHEVRGEDIDGREMEVRSCRQ